MTFVAAPGLNNAGTSTSTTTRLPTSRGRAISTPFTKGIQRSTFRGNRRQCCQQKGSKGPATKLIGTALAFTAKDASKFPGAFDHVCEGNYEMYFDNTTIAYGNDSATDYVAAGYQTSAQVVAVLGSEDWYGYSYGWKGDSGGEAQLGVNKSLYGTRFSGTTYWDAPEEVAGTQPRSLATYRFFKAQLRFTDRAWGQVNWHYDTGHNVPARLCPPAPNGCEIAYSLMSYWYLASPRDASKDVAMLPWPYPFEAAGLRG